jgi:hypothetical protein
MTDRESIAAKIRALLAKRVENGCTEDEAIAAAAKVSELLERYNLTLDEVEMRKSPFERHQETHEDAVGERLWKVAQAIAYLTGSRYWTSRAGVFPIEINFFGFEHEVDVAKYLLDICARTMRREHARLQRDWALINAVARRRKILPFLDGMADRLRERIRALKPPEPTGKGLIVLRDQLIKQGMAAAKIELEDGRGRPSRDLDESYLDGRRTADGVQLARGLAAHGNATRYLR